MAELTMEMTLEDSKARALLDRLGEDNAKEMLKTMMVIRAFEEKAEELYMKGQTHGTMHLSIGQEATAMGASGGVRPGYDYLLNTHRGHGHCLAWGSKPDLTMAEFMGKETGYCRGRGGSMHIADVDRNNLGANGIVAGGVPISVGVGLSVQMRKSDQVVLTLFGDGANNEGAFHESLNMASIWDLPIIYLCENNQYAMSMAITKSMNVDTVAERGAAYNIPGVRVDGNDLLLVYDAVYTAAERARAGDGPTLIEALTYRYKGHSRSDKQVYRTRDEVKEWRQRDPIPRFGDRLKHFGIISDEEYKQLGKQAIEEIEQSVEFAINSPEPELSTIMEGVYA